MRDREWITERPALLAALLLSAAACSKPEPAASVGAASASSAPPAATPLPVGSVIAVDPSWIASDPPLTRLLTGATPACSIRDTFLVDFDGFLAHGYDVYAPALEQAALEQRYREAAAALGYAVTDHPLRGLGFLDEAKRRSGSISDARVSVLIGRDASAREAARKLATSLGFESWALVESLGSKWKWVAIDRSAKGAATIDVKQPATPEARAAIEAFARDKKLVVDGGYWMRKWQKDAPSPTSIAIEISAGGELSILETRGETHTGPACRDHPTRAVEAGKPDAKQPAKSDDDLFREMMGK